MKNFITLCALGLCLISPQSFAANPDLQSQIQAAEKAALAWLATSDTGKYAENWHEAGTLLKTAITQADYERNLQAARTPLGTLVSRHLKSAEYTTSLTGLADGKYVVMQFDTDFSNKRIAVETIVSTLEKKETWKVIGYFIK
ncbi:MAG: DUF4019 domain-containing protein [Glaciimonas sp.]|nr:DUF4019 domain-containing protein [Glaciimonas sp.]